MKVFQLLLICLVFIACSSENKSYIDTIQKERYEKNLQFSNPQESILPKTDIANFKGLDYFQIDEKYKIVAQFERTEGMPIFEMQTTTDRKPLYTTYGKAHFTLNGQEHTLHIYQNQKLMTTVEYADYLFIPFNDLTNGKTSYGGGRYLDLSIPEEGATTIILDFNRVYNPYCAYNSKYSCPIPPQENNLKIAIEAGVKKYH